MNDGKPSAGGGMNPKIFTQILEIAFQKKVSDIHFEVDNPPFFRIHGQLVRSKLPNLDGPGHGGDRRAASSRTTTSPRRARSRSSTPPTRCRTGPGASASASSASGASSAS